MLNFLPSRQRIKVPIRTVAVKIANRQHYEIFLFSIFSTLRDSCVKQNKFEQKKAWNKVFEILGLLP